MKPVFNFIINCKSEELAHYRMLDVESDASIFSRWDLEWCLQAFIRLRHSGNLNVQLSNQLVRNVINIIHSAQLHFLQGTASYFIVCIKADFPRRDWAHFQIVQNKAQLGKDTAHTLFWVQPGLIARNPTREGISTVAYAGQTFNGNLAGTGQEWNDLFAREGIEFKLLPSGACFDVSEVDVLIGIRSFDNNPHNSKPPSKLINAWHSKIPFIGGHDSAFSQVGVPGEDYLQVNTMKEVVEAVLLLKKDPVLYQKLVINGTRKAEHIDNNYIVHNWEKILTGPVLLRYEQWIKRPNYEKLRFAALKNIYNAKYAGKQILKKLLGAGIGRQLQRMFMKN